MSRAEAAGDQRLIAGKIAARYDAGTEAEVLGWIKELTGIEVKPGMREVEKTLHDGITLIKLAQAVQQGTPSCPPKAKKMTLKWNTMTTPFKQMENINIFLKFSESYGVPKTGLFQTVDLYEGRNMAQFLSGVCMLGTECQRNGFNGRCIGARPTTQNIREFSEEQLRAGQSVIGLQAGSNKGASQSGMSIGGVRHVADIRADQMDRDGQGVIGLQAGSNKGASQAGMSMGGTRHAADIRADDFDRDGQSVIGLQAGSNKGASQAGMSMGGTRHAADIRADDFNREGQAVIGLQAGSNKGASQSGMSFGASRHAADIRADDASRAGSGVIGLQMGSNQGASQAGMSMGAQRHVGDIKAGQMDQASSGVINLQMGSNQGESQSGMSMGGRRDIKK